MQAVSNSASRGEAAVMFDFDAFRLFDDEDDKFFETFIDTMIRVLVKEFNI
jgi:hypothetical protein